MSLTGLDPASPRPAIAREYIFAAGPSSGTSPSRPVLIVGNKTATGSETVDAVSDTPITDDTDARARLGLRSEAYAMYRQFVAVPQDADIYVCCPTESGGVAGSCDLTAVGASDVATTWEIKIHGEPVTYSCEVGDAIATTAAGIRDAINAYDSGRLQVIATAALGVCTITTAQKGARANLIIGADATHGIRIRVINGFGNTQVVSKGVIVAGGAVDDHTAAIAAIANGEYYYQVTPSHVVVALTTADNGAGEHLTMIGTQALPINNKDQRLFAGLVGTQAQATTCVTGAGGNSVYGNFFHQESSDWTPGMIAAHCCGVVRQQEIGHPAANINGWSSSPGDGRIFNVPAPFLTADRPTNAEIVADLNNGISPISYVGGRVILERFITSRSLNSAGSNDYRAREGHIPSVMHFCWSILKQRYESIRQPFADDDPTGNSPPAARTMVPSTIKALIFSMLDEFTGSAPMGGNYSGPILKPSALQEMKDSVSVTYAGGGSFNTSIGFQAVEHDLKWSAALLEMGDSY